MTKPADASVYIENILYSILAVIHVFSKYFSLQN